MAFGHLAASLDYLHRITPKGKCEHKLMRLMDSNAAEQMVARTMPPYEANVLGLSVYACMHVGVMRLSRAWISRSWFLLTLYQPLTHRCVMTFLNSP